MVNHQCSIGDLSVLMAYISYMSMLQPHLSRDIWTLTKQEIKFR